MFIILNINTTNIEIRRTTSQTSRLVDYADGSILTENTLDTDSNQAFFIGIRSTFYRLAMLTGQGLLVILAGYFESKTGLETVKLEVKTITQNYIYDFAPDSMATITDSTNQRFISPEEISIAIGTKTKKEADNLLQQIDEWNIKNNFYQTESQKIVSEKEATWWQSNISNKFAGFLENSFGKNKDQFGSDEVGNVGYTWFYLSQKPESGETIVFNAIENLLLKLKSGIRIYLY